MASYPSKQVWKWHLKRIYNRSRFLKSLQSGEFYQILKKNNLAVPDPDPKRNIPPGTRTQTAHYFDANHTKVATVHQMVDPVTNAFRASGYPDPKRLLVNGIIYTEKMPPESGIRRYAFICAEWIVEKHYKLSETIHRSLGFWIPFSGDPNTGV